MRNWPLTRALFSTAGQLIVASTLCSASPELTTFSVSGDAIDSPLTGARGEADRGRAIVLDRSTGNCLICHRVPVPAEPFQGELGPDLTGVASRLSAGQMRLRLVDQQRLNPQTVMPSYYRIAGLTRVDARFAGQPVLKAQDIEDVIAWLETLK